MLSLMVTTLLCAVMAACSDSSPSGLVGLMGLRSAPVKGTISRPDNRARGGGRPEEEGPGLVSGITLLTVST